MFAEQGVFRGFGFSPSGRAAYVEYGSEPNRGAETLMLFDFEQKSTQLLEDMLGEEYLKIDGTVVRAKWITDNAMLLNVWSVIENVGVYRSWIAEWYN